MYQKFFFFLFLFQKFLKYNNKKKNAIKVGKNLNRHLTKEDIQMEISICQDVQHHLSISSVVQLDPTLCNPMNHSMPGLPVHHQLLEFTQTHVHRVSDAIQPSHPLSSPSPPAPNPYQHQSLFH